MSKIKQLIDDELLEDSESFEKQVDYETLQLTDKAKKQLRNFLWGIYKFRTGGFIMKNKGYKILSVMVITTVLFIWHYAEVTGCEEKTVPFTKCRSYFND